MSKPSSYRPRRVNLVVPEELYDLIKRLASVTGKSMSSAVVELLEEGRPVLERVVVVGEAAKKIQDEAKGAMRARIEEAETAIDSHLQAAAVQADMFLADIERRVQKAGQRHADGRTAVGGRRPHAGVKARATAKQARKAHVVTTRRRSRAKPK
jgi:predicted DNA-binding protein